MVQRTRGRPTRADLGLRKQKTSALMKQKAERNWGDFILTYISPLFNKMEEI